MTSFQQVFSLFFFLVLAFSNAFAPRAVGRRADTRCFIVKKYAGGPVNSLTDLHRAMRSITKDNFDTRVQEIEGFMKEKAGQSSYTKGMKRLKKYAKSFAKTLPEGYCKEAKATAKKRAAIKARVEEFIQAKQEAAEAAAAAAAEPEAEAEAGEAAE
eukprot:CAMPEP_0118699926 /NCGR_PEP_ID=MMETSP0800-20121206/16230_1 /TAXON_ID=210618 ORGANISM="Striatella unipunctata, Strain CCMP2910" /NCGR_SAMPLE_ID=MMETSP0800 /ASSEMBLY_ACC=CAM_ASM_000638 /LENGTH=156 /DNA_ID=CAMNT_0006600317 /DNA_START=48 /DNA_END=518 /DNA_ORIENTATION=+